ncbi:MAG: type II toxin-antitoxin system ParD family antitoxin [Rhodanobacteraceae bacterium]|jgi:antitoxin ParD1/3/4|nr:type II toxin-antitoxin system ParD family antitoxin [Rhodanobacteraceae bacterium]MBL0040371.1 type II toxin-antitoxin system ParD family antitoxin [Xanthomonadales bacterium]MBP6078621.1 type II toxin-antitoxin system ParD family antitoxin [Xanthomonadales bacterium]MBP7622790.1 type II toxin-antitoxin system ParD family antitoxin [Xanthomonadales bacterium]
MGMNVAIPSQLEEFIRHQVQSGRYGNASEVVRDGLRLLQERELSRVGKLNELKALIQAGIDSGLAGDLDIAALKQKARQKQAATRGRR